MRVTLVHNSDAGDQAHSIKRILRALEEAGYDAKHLGSKKGLRKGLEKPGDLVVVAGGDGSVKRVSVVLAGRDVPMAIIPIGTANNIAKSLGVIGSIEELVTGWDLARTRRLSVGTVSASFGSERFVESAGVGALTELVTRGGEEIDRNTAGLTGHALDRALHLLRRIVEERPPAPRRLTLDGEDVSGEYLLVEVMNTPLLGPNLPLAPNANPGDDLIELVTVSEAERGVLVEYLQARLAGGAAPPALTVRQGKRVTMHASERELRIDDGPWQPDRPEGADALRAHRGQAEVTVALDDTAVHVLAAE